jgi:hypothetical protein
MAGELWRVVPSAPHILASSEGRVMLAPFLHTMPGNGYKRPSGGTPTFGVWSRRDARFMFTHKGQNYKVARLVCEAFNGPAPEDATVCMHLDENAANNRPDNLAWGTQRENLNAPGFIEYCND